MTSSRRPAPHARAQLRRAGIALALIATGPLPPRALPCQTAARDTTPAPLFTSRDAALAGVLLAGTGALLPFDLRLTRALQVVSIHQHARIAVLDSAFRLTAVPGALIIGTTMYAVGRLTHVERAASLGLYGTEAILMGSAIGGLIKGTLGRARPYTVKDSNAFDFQLGRGFVKGADYSSLPSGHTTAAFAAAAAVTAETSRWWPGATWVIAPTMYGGAVLVALSRMYDDKHWASDVALGAAIGTFTGIKAVRYNHNQPNNRVKRWLLAGSLAHDANGRLRWSWAVVPR